MAERSSPDAPPRPRPEAIIATEVPVYTLDIDLAGIVSNVVYLRWAEIWRMEVLHRMGFTLDHMLQGGLVPTVVRHEINYRRPVRLADDRVRLEGWVERLGRTSVTLWMETRVAGSGQLCCENRQVMVIVDGRTGQAAEMPREYREALERLM